MCCKPLGSSDLDAQQTASLQMAEDKPPKDSKTDGSEHHEPEGSSFPVEDEPGAKPARMRGKQPAASVLKKPAAKATPRLLPVMSLFPVSVHSMFLFGCAIMSQHVTCDNIQMLHMMTSKDVTCSM